MSAAKLILELLKIIIRHGNLPVYTISDNGHSWTLMQIEYMPTRQPDGERDLPKRIELL